MENIILQIDNRERELVSHFQNHEPEYSSTTEFLNMDVGDIQWIDKNSGTPLIVVERKTYSDLSASIKDGRYKEQKERFIYSMQKNIRKIYLLEGDNIKKFTLPEKTFQGVVTNTMLRDHIQVYFTKNINETITFIKNIHKNIEKYIDEIVNEIVNGEEKTYNAENICKSAKKDNITSSICFRNMMKQIPSVSTKLADVLTDKFKSISNFVQTLSEQGSIESKIQYLSEIRFGSNLRKVGLKTAAKIISYLMEGDSEQASSNGDDNNSDDEQDEQDGFDSKKYTDTIDELEKKISTISDQYNSQKDLVNSLQEKIEEKDSKIVSVEESHKKTSDELTELQFKYNELQFNYNDLEFEYGEKNLSYQSLLCRYNTLESNSAKPDDSGLVNSNSQSNIIEGHEETIKFQQEKLNDMQSKLYEQQENLYKQEETLKDHQEKLNTQGETLKDLEQTISSQKEFISSKDVIIEELNHKISDLNKIIERKEHELNDVISKKVVDTTHTLDYHVPLVAEHKDEHSSEHHDDGKKKRGGGRKKKTTA